MLILEILLSANIMTFLELFEVNADSYELNLISITDIAIHYCKDVNRIHNFHGIDFIDRHKIAGYLTYWICKLRPITIKETVAYNKNAYTPLYINELFAFHVSCGRIFDNVDEIEIEPDFSDSFMDSFLYTSKYRQTTGDNLSIVYYLLEENAKNNTISDSKATD